MRVLVCGGRNYWNYSRIVKVLNGIDIEDMDKGGRGIEMIIHGDANGADNCAGAWARVNGAKEWPFPADWNQYGKSAGPIRNEEMLKEGHPDLVVAFPGGTGTKNMIWLAEKYAVPVHKVVDK